VKFLREMSESCDNRAEEKEICSSTAAPTPGKLRWPIHIEVTYRTKFKHEFYFVKHRQQLTGLLTVLSQGRKEALKQAMYAVQTKPLRSVQP
jgi:hypothetical protein